MRVLHVIPSVAARYGGPSAAIVPMCQGLSALGATSHIVTTDADGNRRLPVAIGELTSWQGVPAVFFRKTASESYKYSRQLASWLDENVRAYEVVHIHGVLSHACLAAAAACLRQNVPYVIRPLGTLAPWSLRQKAFRKRLLLRLSGLRALRGAAAIHYTSAEERRTVEASLRLANGVVVPLGIDPAVLEAPRIAGNERDRDPYLLAMSRLHPKKNLEALIDAFVGSRSVDGFERWRLIIAGTGEAAFVRTLEQHVNDRQARGRVTFVGWVDGRDKVELMRRAAVFALCSKHENFGLAVLEALASGVPALLSRHVDLADDVERARAGWIADDVGESLRAAVANAIRDPTERDARGQAARELARRFAWPVVARQLVEMYRTVVLAQAVTAHS
jgi:glycosyltransferase involved in cell wall biosynthesis